MSFKYCNTIIFPIFHFSDEKSHLSVLVSTSRSFRRDVEKLVSLYLKNFF